MKKILNRTSLLVALVFTLIASLIGATAMLTASASTAQEEPTSVVTFTSSTTVMKVDEQFQFAAVVTNEDGTTSTDVTWSSSDEDVIYFEDAGLAYAAAEGTATITATAEDGAFASVDVYVSENAVRVQSIEVYPEVLELGVGWTTRMSYTILPDDTFDQRATWASSDPSVITVDSLSRSI